MLLKLARDIVSVVKDQISSKRIQKIKRLLIRQKITDFKYVEGLVRWSASTEFLEKEEWNLTDVFRVIRPKVKNLPSYTEACKSISSIYAIKDIEAESRLERFSDYIVEKVLNGEVGDETLVDAITTFVNDLENNPIIWNISVEIIGLWLKDEEIEIIKGVKLRKPIPNDLEFERPVESLVPMFVEPISTLSAVLEITQREKSRENIRLRLDKVLLALRLFKIGSVQALKIKWMPKSILESGYVSWTYRLQPVVYKYPLSSEELEKIKTFFNKMLPLLPTIRGRTGAGNHLFISIQRYNDSLFQPDPSERLAYAIMGLESLFLKSREREELAHRLGQRVAKCLSVFDHEPLEVYNIVKNSYDIRSEFIHGSLIDRSKRHDATKLADKIVEYLRICILMMLELKSKIDKEKFLTIVDNSLLHPSVQTKLENLVKENCPVTQSVLIN